MTVHKQITEFLRWNAGVIRKSTSAKPWATWFVIVASATRGILSLLAFMVPLKVILLAASPTIPGYLPFIDPSYKTEWIILLATGAVLVYVLMRSLGPIINYFSLLVGTDILRLANDLPLHSADRKQAQKLFSNATAIFASLIFLIITNLTLYIINFKLAVALSGCLLILYLVSEISLRGDDVPMSKFKSWIIENIRDYISFWEGVSFFVAFGVILLPFLTKNQGHIFSALVSFILVRQMISETSGVIIKSIMLNRERPTLDALLYRNRTVNRLKDGSINRVFRVLFNQKSRDQMFLKAFESKISSPLIVQSRWVDPAPPQVKRFIVSVSSRDPELLTQYFEAQIHAADTRFQAEHAEFLFRHIPPRLVNAPENVAKIDYHGYAVRLFTAGSGQHVNSVNWKSLLPILAEKTFAVIPPKRLVLSYQHTHSMLGDRLSNDFCKRIEAAIDSDADATLFNRWLSALPGIQILLKDQPIALVNPDLNASNVLQVGPDNWLIMYWGKWRFEPIGSAIVLQGLINQAPLFIESLKLERLDLVKRQWAYDLEIAGICQQIEQAIINERARQALSLIEKVLNVIDGKVSREPTPEMI